MSIGVFGGAGHMGSEVTKLLTRKTDAEIVVADYDEDRLDDLTDQVDRPIEVKQVNVENHDEVVALASGMDVAVNTVGPFYVFGTAVLEACIEAGTNYVDICDDYDTTEELLTLHADANAAGITALIGMGSSPGFTNILAKYGCTKLDQVDKIEIYWAESGLDPTGPAAVDHWFHITSGEVPMYLDGELVTVPGLSGFESVSFVPPLNEMETVYTGHSEPMTLSRTIESVDEVVIKGVIYPTDMMNIYQTLNRIGCSGLDEFIVDENTTMPIRELAVKMIRAMPHFAPDFFEELYSTGKEQYGDVAGAVKVRVSGTRDGNSVRHTYDSSLGESISRSTALPATISSQLLLEGDLTAEGVFPPEEVVDPETFLEQLDAERDEDVQECCTERRTI